MNVEMWDNSTPQQTQRELMTRLFEMIRSCVERLTTF